MPFCIDSAGNLAGPPASKIAKSRGSPLTWVEISLNNSIVPFTLLPPDKHWPLSFMCTVCVDEMSCAWHFAWSCVPRLLVLTKTFSLCLPIRRLVISVQGTILTRNPKRWLSLSWSLMVILLSGLWLLLSYSKAFLSINIFIACPAMPIQGSMTECDRNVFPETLASALHIIHLLCNLSVM